MSNAAHSASLEDGTEKAPRSGVEPPWIFRTYAGHSTATASNELYRKNLAKGQTGLSVAFDLPTQTGYDSDHPLAKGEVGKVGVPICHLGDMRRLFEGLPLGDMNTSMTINATAPWLLALYVALAEEQSVKPAVLKGTTQNDIIKEYLSRGTHIFPPRPSLKLTTDVIAYALTALPQWNPVNVCSYHLQEAGATPAQELAFALATAIAILDDVRASGRVPAEDFPRVVGRISFFVNAGIRFITELCKMRAFVDLWDEITRERYGITEEKYRRFRYGVQVNSLGLTEEQPENNIFRIVIEMLAVVLSKDARARAVQLPAWNEALGLPRPWDQQWSLRAQQILAYETDLLEYDDIFSGSPVIAAKVDELKRLARHELARIDDVGGAVMAVEQGVMKEALVHSNLMRLKAIESGEQIVVGLNCFTEAEASPLSAGAAGALTVSVDAEHEQVARLNAWRQTRDQAAVAAALGALRVVADTGANIMPASIAAAKAGATTGEWADCLRRVWGEYRAPTGVTRALPASNTPAEAALRERVATLGKTRGRRLTMLVGKPGLDGHSNGAEQIALRARDCGFTVIYDGIRLTPEEIVARAGAEDVDVIGLSILSGSHVELAVDVLARLRASGLHVPVVLGGIVPNGDARRLKDLGVARIYTPKDFRLTDVIADIVDLVASQH